MAFELLIETGSISNEGAILQINDVSDWSASDQGARASYATIMTAEFRTEATPTEATLSAYDPETAIEWSLNTPQNGRYSLTLHAFYIKDEVVPAEGDVHYDPVANALVQWISAAWVAITEADAISQGKAIYTSQILEIPYLSYAYSYKNVLNLEYIAQVKGDIAKGAEQNKLYYKRTDLDYFNALLDGAGYNWALGNFSNYYEIVANLDAITTNKQIS